MARLETPTNLVTKAISPYRIDLVWTDNSSRENGFVIERNNGTGWVRIAAVARNVTSYSDLTVKPATTYYYRIYASTV